MRWASRTALQAALVAHAAGKLATLFAPAPDEAWRTAVLGYFNEVDRFDRECRAALRVYDRTKVPARAAFEKRAIPIRFDIDNFGRLPPIARVLLLALVDDKEKIGPVLAESKRTRTATEWLPPALTSRGFVISLFQLCTVVDRAHAGPMVWGPAVRRERHQLADIQLAWVHAYLFQEETMASIPPRDLDRPIGQYIESERRRIKKAREHYAEEIRSATVRSQNGVKFVLPQFG
jgi:hypothetical protein